MRLRVTLCVLLQVFFELSSCTHLQAMPGSTLGLPCILFKTDYTGANITWTFNGNDIGAEPSDSVRVQKDGSYRLSISPVTAASSGEYECLVKENNVETISIYKIIVDASIDYTVKVVEGSTVNLPCHLPTSSQVMGNAIWFKEMSTGKKKKLNPEDNLRDASRLELLYPFLPDQTFQLRHTVMEDAGIYHCESTEGARLSTVHVIVDEAPTPVPSLCQGFATPWEPCQDESSRTGEPILQESMGEFSMRLYSYLRESYPSGNLLFSPISISGILSHLLLGARDDTRKAIERAVCVPHDFHCVHFQMKKLREKLAGSLQMASQIYYNPEMDVTESFTNQSIQFYEAEPTRLLENSEDNTRMINSWVANKTRNKITQLVDSVSPSTQLILLNAVSFEGQWKFKFDEKPKTDFFTKLNGDMVIVPVLYHNKYMMAMAYVVELKAQVARFALSGGNSLYVLLPRSNKFTDLHELEEKMTDWALLQMIDQLKTTAPQQVEVSLPQIKLDVQPDMNVVMKKLGLSSLFDGANLCGLYTERKVVLDDARHRAFLALTEQGVEAAAASTMMFSRSLPSFSALRPFIMLLWSDQAEVPLFIGRLTDP